MANEEMARFWANEGGTHWVENEALFDAMLSPFGAAAITAVAPRPGESVLDVGCGFGSTSAQLLDAMGSDGRVSGVDISPVMVERATARVPAASFTVADAQVDDLGGPYDAVVSRFGVMFFDDPVAAFANIAAHVQPGGRLAFVCWRALAENPWMRAAVETMGPFADTPPTFPPPDSPGPLAFADGAKVRRILTDAGWQVDGIAPLDDLAHLGGDAGLDGAVAHTLSTSSGQAVMRLIPEDRHDAAIAALRAELADHMEGGTVTYPAAVWLATAHRGPPR